MSKKASIHDCEEMGRKYLIAEEGAILWDLIGMDFDWLEHFLTTLEELIEEREARDIAAVGNRHLGPIDWSDHYPCLQEGIARV